MGYSYSITVKRGYSTTRLKADGISVYTIKQELHEIGKSTAQTPFGHTVPVYDMERTICDLLRCRSSIEMQTFQGALKMYARRKDKDLRRLMQYAGLDQAWWTGITIAAMLCLFLIIQSVVMARRRRES